MYVNPNSHVSLRQSHLKTDYLFECACALCREQLQQIEQQQNDSNKAAITSNGEAGDISATAADTSVASAADEEDASDVIALAFKAPPGATVDESYASRLKASAARNGSAGHTNGHVNGESDGAADVNGDGEAAGRVKLSAATIKKKKKKAAAKLRQEQEAAEAAAKAHALDPMGFFSSNKPSTPWYEEDDM